MFQRARRRCKKLWSPLRPWRIRPPAAPGAGPRRVTRRRWRRWRWLRAAVTPAAALATAPGIEARSALVSVTPTLFGRRLDLGHVEIVFRPLDGDLLLDECLDPGQIERARLVDEG